VGKVVIPFGILKEGKAERWGSAKVGSKDMLRAIDL